MRIARLFLVLVLAGCSSSPPSAPPPDAADGLVTEDEVILEVDLDLGDTMPDPPVVRPPLDPLAPFPQCRTGTFSNVFAFTLTSWLEVAGPLLGCPAEALDQPDLRLTNNRTTEEIEGLTRVHADDPNDSELAVAFDLREGRIVRAMRRMTPDAQRVVSFYRLEASLAPDRLGAEPVFQSDSRQVFAPTEERPFWIDFYRTPDAIVVEITDAADLAPELDVEEPGVEADTLAAGGAPCDADFERSNEAFMFSEIATLSARLGCPFDEALADLGLDDPIETLEAPDGSVILSFRGVSRIQPGLTVSAQRKADRLAALFVQWPGQSTASTSFMAARLKARMYAGDPPDLDEDARAMWFDDDELRVGIVVQQLPGGATLQLIDARWF
ncbi:MAG: hypothetical protein AAGI52_12755 [Bacteroidota bacterium]